MVNCEQGILWDQWTIMLPSFINHMRSIISIIGSFLSWICMAKLLVLLPQERRVDDVLPQHTLNDATTSISESWIQQSPRYDTVTTYYYASAATSSSSSSTSTFFLWSLANVRDPSNDPMLVHPNPHPVTPEILDDHLAVLNDPCLHRWILRLDDGRCLLPFNSEKLRPWILPCEQACMHVQHQTYMSWFLSRALLTSAYVLHLPFILRSSNGGSKDTPLSFTSSACGDWVERICSYRQHQVKVTSWMSKMHRIRTSSSRELSFGSPASDMVSLHAVRAQS